MGAGILALGAGAALAIGSGTAHADSAGTGSSARAHHQTHTAGPAARSHRVNAPRGSAKAANAEGGNAIAEQDKEIAEQAKAIAEQKKGFAEDVRHVVTTTNFSAFPPEIISARLYAGTGSAALVQAASVWNGLADDLNAAAQGFDRVGKGLGLATSAGPASAAMSAAAPPVVGWLTAAAGQAESAATQASAAAAVYEAAFAGKVPPTAIVANRATLVQLAAANFLSGNVPAIVATEAWYAEMWAQDVAAMVGYRAV
jgi:PPE-repeat protein